MSVAPRSRRLNSSILPRLRSQPIHAPLAARSTAARGGTGRSGRRARRRTCAFSASMPARARARGSPRRPAASRVGRVGEVAEDREVDARIEVAERQHLEVLEQRVHARRRSSAASGRSTIVRASSGTPSEKSRRGSRSRRDQRDDQALDARRSRRRSRAAAASSATSDLDGRRAARCRGVGDGRRDAAAPVSDRDRPEVDGRRVAQHERAARASRAPGR